MKLDILGHDDPTMIRRLEDLTGLDAKTIPLDDKDVMSLFHNTEALGIKPEDIGGTKLGTLGIPEFGTDFCDADVDRRCAESIFGSGAYRGTFPWYGCMDLETHRH